MLPKVPEPQAPHLADWKTIVATICTMEVLASTQIHGTNTWFRELDRIGWYGIPSFTVELPMRPVGKLCKPLWLSIFLHVEGDS